MQRLLLISVLFALVLAAPATAATPVSARLAACDTGSDPAARGATFSASMPLAGAARMATRFQLFQRLPGDDWAAVDVPGWGWDRSDPGRPALLVTKRVEQLLAPAAYRAVVRFRWLDEQGRVVRQTRRTTKACVQPDPGA